MSTSPIHQAEGLRIGTVDFVSPAEIKVLLDIEAPDSVALNAGTPRPFPRVHGYVLIPVDEAHLVGQIEWLTVERSAFPKRGGLKDFGLIDLPYPLRKMSVNPLGTLRRSALGKQTLTFRRGTDGLPTIGSSVLLPTDQQLRSIIESGDRRRVRIGASRLAANAEVSIDPDRVFGRHLAVLGNTGSGKSCSVAGIIRWSLEEAYIAGKTLPNARFVVLDPNGEYSRAFSTPSSAFSTRVFRIGAEEGTRDLRVPLWFWNSAEWASFTQASAKTQRPLLRRALREIKGGRADATDNDQEARLEVRRYISSMLVTIRRDLHSGAVKTDESKFGFRLVAYKADLEQKVETYPDLGLEEVIEAVQETIDEGRQTFTDKTKKEVVYFRAFKEETVQGVVDALSLALEQWGGLLYQEGPDEDVPIPFSGPALADHLQFLAEQENVTQYLDFLVARMRTFLSDARIKAVVDDEGSISLKDWLEDYVGGEPDKGQLAILDLSLVPSEVIHVVTAVTARMIFEALQRYRRSNGAALPTVLVMEEAHTFVKRYRDDSEHDDAAKICCQVFERIAREGRKFGLGLVLSSQRPSELSPTVLSQCNTFLLHRISNDRDQEIVQRLVPDNLRGLLRELPSLPSQAAILLGWASELPVLVNLRDLPRSQQPHSDDPDFWDVWTGAREDESLVSREADWSQIADEWQQKVRTEQSEPVDSKPDIPPASN